MDGCSPAAWRAHLAKGDKECLNVLCVPFPAADLTLLCLPKHFQSQINCWTVEQSNGRMEIGIPEGLNTTVRSHV